MTINAEKLKLRTNLSPETMAKIRTVRLQTYQLQKLIDDLGESEELEQAFRHLLTCQFFVDAHLSYMDYNAVKESF